MVGTQHKSKSRKQLEGRYGRFKSRSKKLVYVKTPGGRTVTHYKKKTIGNAKCASCVQALPGVASKRQNKMKNMSKTKKKVARPYGGNLCSKCMRKKIISEARSK